MFQDAVTNAIKPVDLTGRAGPADRTTTMVAWQDLPGMLLRRGAWIVSGVLAAFVAALLIVALLPPAYTASTDIVVQPTDLKAVDGSVNQVSNQPDTSVALVETAARVIRSSKVLEPVIEKLGLADDPEFVRRPSRLRALVGQVRQALHIEVDTPASDPMEDALQQLTKQLAVSRSERTFVISLSVKANDPVRAARIANAIVDSFLAVQASARADASRRVSDALTSRLGELRDSVRRSENAVQQFKVAHNLVTANGQLVNEQQLSEASAQLLSAQSRTADAKAKLDQVDAAAHGRDPGAIPESLQSQTITALRSQLAQAGKQEADARVTFGARHPQLAQMRSQVEAVRRALDEEVQRIRDTARSEFERARASESALRANLLRQQAEGTKANAAQIRLRELERDAEASRSVYEAFLVRARETAEQERVDTLNAWVMSPATAPTDRSFPPSNLAVFGAALTIGLGFGVGCALLRERLDPRLWTRARVETVTGVPVLATLAASRRRPAAGPQSPQRIPFRENDELGDFVRDVMDGRVTVQARIVLMVGSNGDVDAGVAARYLADAAVAEGVPTTLVRIAATGGPAAPLQSTATGRGAEAWSPTRLEMAEPSEPRDVPLLVERLKACATGLGGGGLLIVASRRDTQALSQLALLADASVLVVTRARTTRAEAVSTVQRLRAKAGALRGAIMVRQTA